MKKTFLAITALAAMLFAGCTSSDELTTLESIKTADNTPTPVQFGTYMSKVGTRAGSEGDIAAQTTKTPTKVLAERGGFGVFAYYTGAADYSNSVSSGSQIPNFMYNQPVTSADGNSWTYTPVKYWPNQYANGDVDSANPSSETDEATATSNLGKVSFFAYAPYVSATDISTDDSYGISGLSANTSSYDPTVTYKLAPKSGEYVDLLWGVKVNGAKEATPTTDTYNVNLTKNSANLTSANKDGQVRFLFKHALTKIGGSTGLKIVYDIDGNGTGETGTGSDDANTLVTVSEITIKNVADKITKEGVFDLATGDWAATNTTAAEGSYINLHFTPSGSGSGETQLNEAIAEATFTNDGTTGWQKSSSAFEGVRTTAKDVFKAETAPIYLIPGDDAQQLTVTITYVVRTYDGNLDAFASGETSTGKWTKVTQTISNIVTLPTSLVKPNKKITLVIHLGLTSVKFAAAVDDWENVTGTNSQLIWLPSNIE